MNITYGIWQKFDHLKFQRKQNISFPRQQKFKEKKSSKWL